MAYRIDKRKKVVRVRGHVDLVQVWDKVASYGGPVGWSIVTFITHEDIQHIAAAIQDDEPEEVRTIGFRVPSEPSITTGLPFSPPETDD